MNIFYVKTPYFLATLSLEYMYSKAQTKYQISNRPQCQHFKALPFEQAVIYSTFGSRFRSLLKWGHQVSTKQLIDQQSALFSLLI